MNSHWASAGFGNDIEHNKHWHMGREAREGVREHLEHAIMLLLDAGEQHNQALSSSARPASRIPSLGMAGNETCWKRMLCAGMGDIKIVDNDTPLAFRKAMTEMTNVMQ